MTSSRTRGDGGSVPFPSYNLFLPRRDLTRVLNTSHYSPYDRGPSSGSWTSLPSGTGIQQPRTVTKRSSQNLKRPVNTKNQRPISPRHLNDIRVSGPGVPTATLTHSEDLAALSVHTQIVHVSFTIPSDSLKSNNKSFVTEGERG